MKIYNLSKKSARHMNKDHYRRFIFQEDRSTYRIGPDTKVAKRRLCAQAFLINCPSQGLGNSPIENDHKRDLYESSKCWSTRYGRVISKSFLERSCLCYKKL
ncbi:hypothetical protein F4703DRAFT_1794053 [Phycomyces blakesleeanus]